MHGMCMYCSVHLAGPPQPKQAPKSNPSEGAGARRCCVREEVKSVWDSWCRVGLDNPQATTPPPHHHAAPPSARLPPLSPFSSCLSAQQPALKPPHPRTLSASTGSNWSQKPSEVQASMSCPVALANDSLAYSIGQGLERTSNIATPSAPFTTCDVSTPTQHTNKLECRQLLTSCQSCDRPAGRCFQQDLCHTAMKSSLQLPYRWPS